MLISNLPLDAVGIHAHHDVGATDWVLSIDEVKKSVEKFRALGLEVHTTELDIDFNGQIWSEALAERQKQDNQTGDRGRGIVNLFLGNTGWCRRKMACL